LITELTFLLQKYANKSGSGKNWAFPKMHWIEHAFDDIEAKGATRNYNTKPNEKLHGPLKKAFARTNGKDIVNQVCYISFTCFHYTVIDKEHNLLKHCDRSWKMTTTVLSVYILESRLRLSTKKPKIGKLKMSLSPMILDLHRPAVRCLHHPCHPHYLHYLHHPHMSYLQ
jgi:hypothetical protein